MESFCKLSFNLCECFVVVIVCATLVSLSVITLKRPHLSLQPFLYLFTFHLMTMALKRDLVSGQ